ncbi:uncharacterized protein BYT42DRAFT_577475 [Radiomyces spectabilis]|uniref:uncharacterized protein n=1 Tax=Radiomyces spectabilis TaxID=64574 RepID=UPI00222027F7|nr:uncharacterized protein BYT42DRAFT_577475 [Radiomyces spectabilis]KAI8374739.1 hypothetical protein BYT42DRAFT_577475 [Radiomyces spectabilis]
MITLPMFHHHRSPLRLPTIQMNLPRSSMNVYCFRLMPFGTQKDPSEWLVRTKGWALSHNSMAAKQKMMISITKTVAGKSPADASTTNQFQQRFKYFLAKNKRNKQFVVKAIGTSTIVDFYALNEGQDYLAEYSSDDNDPMLVPRPGNPVSSILDRRRSNYAASSSSIPSLTSASTVATDEFDEISGSEFLNYMENQNTIQSNSTNGSSLFSPEFEQETGLFGAQVESESSGLFSGEFTLPESQVIHWANQQDHVECRLIQLKSIPKSPKFVASSGMVSLVEPTGISIISDIDDTIKDTRILAGARAVLNNTFFKPAKEVDGMAEAYMQWYTQGASIHYVSNSPFQLMVMLEQFLREHHFPPGSMHLRMEGSILARLVEVPGRAKRDAIISIIRDFPQRLFILVGDSGEIDLEIYTKIATEFPGRILKIFIRDVTTPHALRKASRSTSTSKPVKRSNTLTSLFSPKQRSSVDDDTKQPVDVDNPLTTPTLAELVLEPSLTGHSAHPLLPSQNCIQFHERLCKARKQLPNVDIVLFRHADELKNDTEIQRALWKNWDDQSSTLSL